MGMLAIRADTSAILWLPWALRLWASALVEPPEFTQRRFVCVDFVLALALGEVP
jgi:hypothetical protein